MRITKTTIIILLSMILLSVFIANILNILNTDEVLAKTSTINRENFLKISDTNEHLIWFLQISDIHISIFRDPRRISEFKEFCQYTVDRIKPSVVLASGDLTDAKTKDGIGSRQFEKEWQHYRNTLNECDINHKTIWLDIRGNHDNFNVANVESKQNYFTNYSIQGRLHPKSYIYQLRQSNELYSFIGIDACLEPGPKRPFNFIGMIDQIEIEQINHLININYGANYTIWFGHFPTSCILSTGYENIRNLINKDRKSYVYLCGHLHQLGGVIPNMYTLQKNGFLELELGDWKDNRVYRLMAIDHGLLSFIDLKHNEWPIVLITNPKHALFLNPIRENLENMRQSTHIRILAFSLDPIVSVRVRIDKTTWLDCYHIDGPLYVTKWKPERFLTGVHHIEVEVVDEMKREKIYTQPFTLDSTERLSFNLLSRMVLMTSASTIFRGMFGVMLLISILPLSVLRLIDKMVNDKKLTRPYLLKKHRNCCKLWLRKFWLLSTVDRIYWPLILYPIYLTFGPWSIGYLLEDHLGVIFAWGIFVNGHFLPGSFTYAYGFLQLVSFQIPLTFILAHGVDYRFQHKILEPEKKKTVCNRLMLHIPFFLIFGIQVVMAYLFWLAYGTLAFILGFLRTWSLILAAILWYQAIYLPDECTRRAAEIWRRKSIDLTKSQTIKE